MASRQMARRPHDRESATVSGLKGCGRFVAPSAHLRVPCGTCQERRQTMVVQDQVTWKEVEAQLIARAWTDEAFADELRRHPKATIEREMGQRLPADVKVQILE